MNADRLFMLVDTCANIDEVKHEFPDLDFLTYFYALLGYYCIPTDDAALQNNIVSHKTLEIYLLLSCPHVYPLPVQFIGGGM